MDLEQEPELKVGLKLEMELLNSGQTVEELGRLLLGLARAGEQHQFVVGPSEQVELLEKIALEEHA